MNDLINKEQMRTILSSLKDYIDNNREVNRLDNEKIDFHNKVREGYYKILEKDKDRIVKVDASKTIDEVYEDVKYIITEWLDK